MERIILTVDGMSCSHCIKTVENSLCDIDDVVSVRASLDSGEVEVVCRDGVEETMLADVIDDLGYEVIDCQHED